MLGMKRLGLPAALAATALYSGSPFLFSDFDVRDAPEAPPLSAIASLIASSADGVVFDAVSDSPIDVRPHLFVSIPST